MADPKNSALQEKLYISKRYTFADAEWKGLKFDATSKEFKIKNEQKMHSK